MKKAGHLLFFTCLILLLSSCGRQYTYYQLMPRRDASSFAVKYDHTSRIKKISGPVVASNKPGISEEEKAFVLKKLICMPLPTLIIKKKTMAATHSFQTTTAAVLHTSGKETIPATGESMIWSQRTYLFLWIICLIGAIWLSALQIYLLSFVLWVAFIIFLVIWAIRWANSR